MAGRVVLLKHVLSLMPTHIIVSSRLQNSVINDLHCKMVDFLWRGRYHWRSWPSLCHSTEEGGLGIRNLIDIQKAYDCQLW